MTKLLLVMAGGSIGALSRYGTAILAVKLFGPRFPWGTLLVNLTGCFLIGFCYGLIERSAVLTPSLRLFFITGFLGSLTTFSTFALETAKAVRADDFLGALVNFLLNNVAGIVLVFLGMWAARIR